MYAKQQVSLIKKEFWTAFGQYMKPVPSAEGERINWINYKTGEKDIVFSMDANTTSAVIEIRLTHPNAEVRMLYFEQLSALRSFLQEKWIWKGIDSDNTGRPVSRVYASLEGVNICNRNDWPSIIAFLKGRMIALDDFWSTARYSVAQLK